MKPHETIFRELKEASGVLEKFLSDDSNLEKIENAAELITISITNGGKVISCGNGGSHCDAMHFAEELTGKYRDSRKPLPAIAISDPGYISCVANDFGYEQVFSRFIEGLGNPGDCLLAISTSGNSINIIKAAEAAHEKNMKVIALTGNSGGKLASNVDIEIRVPHQGYADRIQEIHIKIIHVIINLIEQRI